MNADAQVSEMTDTPAPQEVSPKPAQRPPGDWLLETLVSLANEHDHEYGITLFLGGGIVTGFLIGGRDYFNRFADEMAASITDPEEADLVRKSYQSFKRHYPERVDGELRSPARREIYCARAKAYSGKPGRTVARSYLLYRRFQSRHDGRPIIVRAT